jgi:hypothetical protein
VRYQEGKKKKENAKAWRRRLSFRSSLGCLQL